MISISTGYASFPRASESSCFILTMPRNTKHLFRPRTIPCTYADKGCNQLFSDHSGLTRHLNTKHRGHHHSHPLGPTVATLGHGHDRSEDEPELGEGPQPFHEGPDGGAGPSRSGGHNGDRTSADARHINFHPFLNGVYMSELDKTGCTGSSRVTIFP